ncbi:uncharacterized protein LOC113469231 isoform X2 [Diaphorina citri]|uniref:Uncharacterized protein LOC113469231 isoform X1 n=1 Tax=Diaphorina citri TaxID=121845 RepID=A0A3Q0J2D0_DIACI|nr:uncharacterized protein LOC113469231 isoform X1 [Diaphorina citri]XP_026682582.1 uncharacterized protein LOC113469231 isoform X2 [Diaphorina citri]
MTIAINELLSKNIIYTSPESIRSGFLAPMFLRQKPNGSIRPIFKLKPLNQYIKLRRFRLINHYRIPGFLPRTCKRGPPKVSIIPFRRKDLFVEMPTLRTSFRSSSLQPVNELGGGASSKTRVAHTSLSRRFSDSGSVSPASRDPLSHGRTPPSTSWVASKHRKILLGSMSNKNLSRATVRHPQSTGKPSPHQSHTLTKFAQRPSEISSVVLTFVPESSRTAQLRGFRSVFGTPSSASSSDSGSHSIEELTQENSSNAPQAFPTSKSKA